MEKEFKIVDFSDRYDRVFLYEALLKTNGFVSQFKKLSEECNELSEATETFLSNQSKENRDAMVSEIVDVENMIEQIKILLSVFQEEFNKERNFKLSRTASRFNL